MSQKTVSQPTQKGYGEVGEILHRHPAEKAHMIPMLQDIQEHYGYLPEHAIDQVSRYCGISMNEVYGVATFYTQFRFNPPGEHTIRVCQGTACHVRQGRRILEEVEKKLGIKAGQTTADGTFGMERVACLGCCALAPVMMIDDKVHAKVSTKTIGSILAQYSGKGTEVK